MLRAIDRFAIGPPTLFYRQTSTWRVSEKNWWICCSIRGSIITSGRFPFGQAIRGVVPNRRQISGRSA
jgi:hypothetical protein